MYVAFDIVHKRNIREKKIIFFLFEFLKFFFSLAPSFLSSLFRNRSRLYASSQKKIKEKKQNKPKENMFIMPPRKITISQEEKEQNRARKENFPPNIWPVQVSDGKTGSFITEHHDTALQELMETQVQPETEKSIVAARKKLERWRTIFVARLVQETLDSEGRFESRNVYSSQTMFESPVRLFPYDVVKTKRPWDVFKQWLDKDPTVMKWSDLEKFERYRKIQYIMRQKLLSWIRYRWFDDGSFFTNNLYPLGYNEILFSGIALKSVDSEVQPLGNMAKIFSTQKKNQVLKFVKKMTKTQLTIRNEGGISMSKEKLEKVLCFKTVDSFLTVLGDDTKKTLRYSTGHTSYLLFFHFLLETHRRHLDVSNKYLLTVLEDIFEENEWDTTNMNAHVPTKLDYTTQEKNNIRAELDELDKPSETLDQASVSRYLLWSSRDISVRVAALGIDLFKIMPSIFGKKLKFSIEIATIKSIPLWKSNDNSKRNRYFALCYESSDEVVYPIVLKDTDGQEVSIFEYQPQKKKAKKTYEPIHTQYGSIMKIFHIELHKLLAKRTQEEVLRKQHNKTKDDGPTPSSPAIELEDEGSASESNMFEPLPGPVPRNPAAVHAEDFGEANVPPEPEDDHCTQDRLKLRLDLELKDPAKIKDHQSKNSILFSSILSVLDVQETESSKIDLQQSSNDDAATIQRRRDKLFEVERAWLFSKISSRSLDHTFVSSDQTILDFLLVYYLKKLANACARTRGKLKMDLRPILNGEYTSDPRNAPHILEMKIFQDSFTSPFLVFDPDWEAQNDNEQENLWCHVATGTEQKYFVALILFLYRMNSKRSDLPEEMTLTICRTPGTENGPPELLFVPGVPLPGVPLRVQSPIRKLDDGGDGILLFRTWNFCTKDVVSSFGKTIVADVLNEILCSEKFVQSHLGNADPSLLLRFQSLAAYNDPETSRINRKGTRKKRGKDSRHYATMLRFFGKLNRRKDKVEVFLKLKEHLKAVLKRKRANNLFAFPTNDRSLATSNPSEYYFLQREKARLITSQADLKLVFPDYDFGDLKSFVRSVYWTENFCFKLHLAFMHHVKALRQRKKGPFKRNWTVQNWYDFVSCTLGQLWTTWICNFVCKARNSRTQEHHRIFGTWSISFACVFFKIFLKTVTVTWFLGKVWRELETHYRDQKDFLVFLNIFGNISRWYPLFCKLLKQHVADILESTNWKNFCTSVKFQFQVDDDDTQIMRRLDAEVNEIERIENGTARFSMNWFLFTQNISEHENAHNQWNLDKKVRTFQSLNRGSINAMERVLDLEKIMPLPESVRKFYHKHRASSSDPVINLEEKKEVAREEEKKYSDADEHQLEPDSFDRANHVADDLNTLAMDLDDVIQEQENFERREEEKKNGKTEFEFVNSVLNDSETSDSNETVDTPARRLSPNVNVRNSKKSQTANHLPTRKSFHRDTAVKRVANNGWSETKSEDHLSNVFDIGSLSEPDEFFQNDVLGDQSEPKQQYVSEADQEDFFSDLPDIQNLDDGPLEHPEAEQENFFSDLPVIQDLDDGPLEHPEAEKENVLSYLPDAQELNGLYNFFDSP